MVVVVVIISGNGCNIDLITTRVTGERYTTWAILGVVLAARMISECNVMNSYSIINGNTFSYALSDYYS
jgi:hypothetical protein